MKRFLFLVLLLLPAPCWSASTHNTSGPQAELEAWAGDWASPYVRSGCLGAAQVAKTETITACKAYVYDGVGSLFYVPIGSTTIVYPAANDDVCWVVVSDDVDGVIAGWTRFGAPGKAYYVKCEGDTTPNRPTLPARSTWVMERTVTGGALDAPIDLRNMNTSGVDYVNRYLSLAAAADEYNDAGDPQVTLRVSSPVGVTANLTMTTNIDLDFLSSGKIVVETGKMLTYKGSCAGWPLRQLFDNTSGGGIVLFPSDGKCKYLYSIWWGDTGDGTTDDTNAINSAFAALAVSSNVGSAGSPGIGGTVRILSGIHRTTDSILGTAYTSVLGDGWRNTVIQMDTGVAGNVPVFLCTDCRWSTINEIAFETDVAVDGASGRYCLDFERTGEFGNKINVDSVATRYCSDSLYINGDVTNGTFRRMYLRDAARHGFHTSATTAMSASLADIYVSTPGDKGYFLEGGIGAGTMRNLVAENTGGAAMYIFGCNNLHMSGIYLGDNSANGGGHPNGLTLQQCGDVTVDGIFINLAAGAGSRILLDGSYGVVVRSLFGFGGCTRYSVEWANLGSVDESYLQQGNKVEIIRESSACISGHTNDTAHVSFSNVAVFEDHSSPLATTKPFYKSQTLKDMMTWKTMTRPNMASQAATAYVEPESNERWGYIRELGAVDSPTVTTSPSYGYYGMNAVNFIGVMQGTEDLGSSVVTGASSNFDDGTVGSWTVTGDASCAATSVNEYAGTSGLREMRFACTGTGSGSQTFGRAKLTLSGLTVGKLYKVQFAQREAGSICSTGCDQVTPNVYDAADSVILATAPRVAHISTAGWHTLVMYFQATDTTAILSLYLRDNDVGTNAVLYDTFTVKPVKSSGVMILGGGRKADVTADKQGGAYIEAYGDDHASKPGYLYLQSKTAIAIPAFAFANLPGSAPTNSIAICTDCAAGCAAGGGSRRIVMWSGSAWSCP